MESKGSSKLAHVLIISLPIQGHVTPLLHIAQLLCHANLKVTFLCSTQVHQHLAKSNDLKARFAKYPGFDLQAVTDGLPEDHPRAGAGGCRDVIMGFASNAEPRLRELLTGSNPFTCLIVDGWLNFAHDVAHEVGLPVIGFRVYSACNHWVFSCIPQLFQAEVPFQDEDMDRLVESVPGMESFLRCRDLPHFCRIKDKAACQGILQGHNAELERAKKAVGIILNTFEGLEGPDLSLIRSHGTKIYSIGPLHSLLEYRLAEEKTALSCNSSSSLWEMDRSCLSWLDQKPDKSVIYVSFGSVAVMEREQVMEIWAGLVQSQKYFLWVIRPNLIAGSNTDLPNLEGSKERGCIVSWCPQEEVLAHRAVGGFLTHSGWNSTLESITASVPMLCWPYFADQQVNSRYVNEVWRVGLDMKDTWDRKTVEKMVNDLMEKRKDELQESMAKMTESAKRSIREGGSSYCNLDNLIQDIKEMAMKNAPEFQSFTTDGNKKGMYVK